MATPDTFESFEVAAPQSAPSVVAVTILWHPDLGRVGDVAEWDGRGVFELARTEPAFATPGGDTGAPLGTDRLSRKRFGITARADGGCVLTPADDATQAATVDGRPLVGGRPLTLSGETLSRGVCWTIGRRVALWLERRPRWRAAPVIAGYTGESEPALRLREAAHAAARTQRLLLQGASGTGKQLVAQAIARAARGRDPVMVDAGAVAPTLWEAEFFGVERNAVPSIAQREGHLARAHGGTLFLDEVHNMSLEDQGRLLGVLGGHAVRRVGEAGPGRVVDIVLVAATNCELTRRVAEGTFRADFLARLGTTLVLPPLERRMSDLGRMLVRALHAAYTRHHPSASALPHEASRWLGASDISDLTRRRWPENARGVEKLAELLVVRHAAPSPEPWSDALAASVAGPGPAASAGPPASGASVAATSTATSLARERLLAALDAERQSVARAARALEISENTVRARMKKDQDVSHLRALGATRVLAAVQAAPRDLAQAAAALGVDRRVLAYVAKHGLS